MHKLLRQWDNSLSAKQHAALDLSLERRSFLANTLKAAATLSLLPGLIQLSACSKDPELDQQSLIQQEPWKTFATVQQILFPDDGNGPSAMDIHAALYLKFVLEAPDTEAADREFILNGINWLNDLSQQTHQKPFILVNVTQQDALLKQISQSRAGERWLSTLLLYIFEALLSDPAYGANPDGIGWRWLEHQPGFPSPPKNKIYTRLL